MAVATERQQNFLRTLITERTVAQHGITDVDAFMAIPRTKQEASRLIDTLIAMPRQTAARAEATVRRADVTGTRTLENGTYTVVRPDGTYVTLRVKAHWEADRAARGDQVVQYLSGPDNTTNFTGFAFLNGTNARVWSRMVGRVNNQNAALCHLLNQGVEDRATARETYALRSGRCSNCGRRLTVPASLHRGLGPECARRLGAEDPHPSFHAQSRHAARPAEDPAVSEAAFTIYAGEGTFDADTLKEAKEFAATLTTTYEIRDRAFNHVATGNER